MICTPPYVVWLAGTLLAGLCSIDTRGYKVFPGVPHALDGAVNSVCGLPLFSHIHPPPSNTINNPPSWRVVHNPADDSTTTTTIPLDQMLDLDDPQEWRNANAHLLQRWWAPDASLAGVLGLLHDKEMDEQWEGTASGLLVAALSMALRQERQDNDNTSGPSTSCPMV
jgi:hypothetical protein